jgi:hypothetical protein
MDGRSEERVGDWRKGKGRAKRIALRDPSVKVIDCSFFQPLAELANAVKNLVAREGHQRFPGSPISADIAVMLNQLRVTFDLVRFVNADERRDNDPGYRLGYSFVALPLTRTLIDGFYNITVLLDDPSKARVFRLSGYKRMLAALRADEELYGKESGWPEYIAQQRGFIRTGYTADGFREEHLQDKADWVLLSRYLQSPAADDSDHKKLMRRFIHGPWRQYSEISHVTFRGVHELFEVLNTDAAPHQHRSAIFERAERSLTQHLGRTATVLLAVISEIQAVYRFEGHSVNARLHAMWREMVNFSEGKEMYTLHYKALMETNRITDVLSDPL